MGRAPCCDKARVKKGPWSPEEDAKLKDFIHKHGTAGNWIALPHKAGLKRCGKSCRLRWLNYLRPNIKHGDFSQDEDTIICTLYATIGSRWSIIAGQLPGRTDNDIKNYWNTKLRKKLLAMLPSFQNKPSVSMAPLQPPPFPHNFKPDTFLNPTSASLYSFNPTFMNVSWLTTTTTTTTGLVHDNINVTDLLISPPSNPLNGMINDYYLGFQEHHHHNMMNKDNERMLIFGGSDHELTTAACSSSEGGGSFMSHLNYNRHQYHQPIKQQDKFGLEGFGDDQRHGFTTDDNYIDQKPNEYLKKDVID